MMSGRFIFLMYRTKDTHFEINSRKTRLGFEHMNVNIVFADLQTTCVGFYLIAMLVMCL